MTKEECKKRIEEIEKARFVLQNPYAYCDELEELKQKLKEI